MRQPSLATCLRQAPQRRHRATTHYPQAIDFSKLTTRHAHLCVQHAQSAAHDVTSATPQLRRADAGLSIARVHPTTYREEFLMLTRTTRMLAMSMIVTLAACNDAANDHAETNGDSSTPTGETAPAAASCRTGDTTPRGSLAPTNIHTLRTTPPGDALQANPLGPKQTIAATRQGHTRRHGHRGRRCPRFTTDVLSNQPRSASYRLPSD